MKNPGLAAVLGFNTAEFTKERFQKKWLIFRDDQMSKFLMIFMEKRIEELRLTLENTEPQNVQRLQGQILEAKKLRQFLEQSSIENEVGTTAQYLGLT